MQLRALLFLPLWLLCTPVASSAATLVFALDFEFSGATAPAGVAPWVSLTLDDSVGGANDVRLTISNPGLTAQEFVSAVHLNFDPSLDVGDLTVAPVDQSASVPTVSASTDAFKADGDGFFDILFDFPTAAGAEFAAGETVVFDLTFTSPIDVSDFDFDSAPGGGAGSYAAAAHVQGIGAGGEDSGWIGNGGVAPEPGTALLLLLPAGLLASRRLG